MSKSKRERNVKGNGYIENVKRRNEKEGRKR